MCLSLSLYNAVANFIDTSDDSHTQYSLKKKTKKKKQQQKQSHQTLPTRLLDHETNVPAVA